MKLSTLFNNLARGELGNHAYGNSGQIKPEDYPHLITHIQLSLTALCIRFPIFEKQLQLVMVEESAGKARTKYKIGTAYAIGAGEPSSLKYIKDSVASPFVMDVLSYTGVFDTKGEILPLNNDEEVYSIFTPYHNVVQVSEPVIGENLYLMYQSDHPIIPLNGDPETIDIDIPVTLEEALMCATAARIYSHLRNETSNAASSFYYQKYQSILMELENRNTLNSGRFRSNAKLEIRGFY